MSIEQALISRAQPHMIAARVLEILTLESSKGCTPELSNEPVCLEPFYTPSNKLNKTPDEQQKHHVEMIPWSESNLERYKVWISKNHKLEWFRAELFIRLLRGVSHRVVFEITGNEEEIQFSFLINKNDRDLLQTAMEGEFSHCKISSIDLNQQFKENISFYDFFPIPPYHHLLTKREELHTSPYEPFIRALCNLQNPANGFVQIIFEPARHNWHQNIDVLTDIEFLSQTMGDVRSPHRTPLQLPSGDLRHMAVEVETKAHNDRPLYFTALRVGIITPENTINPWALASFTNLFQHGGQPLQYITEEEYEQKYNKEQIKEMFQLGLSYRSGFLLNSLELAGLIHIPTLSVFDENDIPIKLLETLPIPKNNKTIQSGIVIGFSKYAGTKEKVCVEDLIRTRSIHMIGKPDTGKSTLIENMVLQDISSGNGLAFFDPHGDSIKKLLQLIPKEKTDSVIYLDFGNHEWFPVWNPIKILPGQSISRTADVLVSAIKSIVKSHSWGDRLEHLLRHGFYALLQLNNATFLDLLNLLTPKNVESSERNKLKKMILDVVDNEAARIFWSKDYDKYNKDDFTPPKHKLSKLLIGDETTSLMLSQSESLLNFREIMDSGKILLVDLSNLGPETRSILGCFLLSFLHLISLTRSDLLPENRKQFHIYCDEAHLFTTDSLEDMIAETRKFGVSFVLSHQYLSQFSHSQRDALSSVGTTIIFNVDITDSQYLVKDLRGMVKVQDIVELKKGQAIARIGTDIVRIHTPKPKEPIPESSYKELIIQQSREKYYRRIREVKENIRLQINSSFPKYIPFEPIDYEFPTHSKPFIDEFK